MEVSEGESADTDSLITFFFDSKEVVNSRYEILKDVATSEPRENAKYRIYNFFARDPDGRRIEFQVFNHELLPLVSSPAMSTGVAELKYCLNVEIRPSPERREEFLAAVAVNQAGTLNRDIEPGNLHYHFGENANEPNVFHFQEQFVNKCFPASHKNPSLRCVESIRGE